MPPGITTSSATRRLWPTSKTGSGWRRGGAKRYVDLARFVHRFSATMAAWRQCHINSDQAKLLGHAAAKLPDKFPSAEPVLLEIVGDDPGETRKALDYWTSTAEKDEIGVDAQLARRFLAYGRTDSGMVEGEFSLPAMVRHSSPPSMR